MLKLLSNNFYRLSGGSVTLLALLILASFIVFFLRAQADRAAAIAGKAGTPKDVAALDAFLLSTEADWITGQIISVYDGRSTLRTNVSKMEIEYGRNPAVFCDPETQRD